ncbi:MAG: type I glyceraldehyde-3-phosphate dehydrogenase [Candidatus Dadabacteria bacterium]|nr:type I glyceraldehyde-3-phosphate dehydrogenase [Candidatus Dadabacteria bacterium]
MNTKVGINGFGRIGRGVLRAGLKHGSLDFVAVNDITSPAVLAHLFKYDSVFGVYPGKVKVAAGGIEIDGNLIRTYSERDPSSIGWAESGVGIVVESTGVFRSRAEASAHLGGTVKKVVITAPAKGGVDLTAVLGVNGDSYDPAAHDVVSNASCTTNCFSMLVKVLHEKFGVRRGEMTTVHSYTSDQRIHDAPHSDLRRARAAGLSIIPTSTGAAEVIQEVFPELRGKLSAMAVRVPTPNVSLVDFSCEVGAETSPDEVNAAFKEAAQGRLKGLVGYLEDELVSTDLVGSPYSAAFDPYLTSVTDGNLVKVIAWYDNEYGYSSRVVDLVSFMAERGI